MSQRAASFGFMQPGVCAIGHRYNARYFEVGTWTPVISSQMKRPIALPSLTPYSYQSSSANFSITTWARLGRWFFFSANLVSAYFILQGSGKMKEGYISLEKLESTP